MAAMNFAYQPRELPPLAPVRQTLRGDKITDVRSDVREKLLGSGLLERISADAKIAITGSSRGIGGFVELLGGICDAVRSRGGEPFIVPSMGSHGGATVEGQIEILKRLGVDESALGAPIRATMETRELGRSETGAVAHLDDLVASSDGVIVLGRPKAHPENAEGIASGLLKMTTVGLGKQAGAQSAHTHGLWKSVRAVPKITLAKAPILCGVAAVENGYRDTAIVEVVPPTYEAFKEADERLLKASEPYFAELPLDDLDLLIVDKLGKDISGTGMDLNIIGDWRMKGGETKPDYRRIVVLSLTPASLGNGLGIGLADLTTRRFVDEFSWHSTYVNLFTASEPGLLNTREGQLPLALPSDRNAIEAGLFSSLAGSRPRICRIKSTAELDEFWVSEELLDEVGKNEKLSVISQPETLGFDKEGNLF
jgi:hypothetical protein